MTGKATIDFGAAGQWNVDVSTVVTGIPSILSTSYVEAYFQGDATADNDADAHLIASRLITVTAGSIVPGVGFTITAQTDGDVTGTFQVRWATA